MLKGNVVYPEKAKWLSLINVSIPAPFEPAVWTLRATLPALRATFPVGGVLPQLSVNAV